MLPLNLGDLWRSVSYRLYIQIPSVYLHLLAYKKLQNVAHAILLPILQEILWASSICVLIIKWLLNSAGTSCCSGTCATHQLCSPELLTWYTAHPALFSVENCVICLLGFYFCPCWLATLFFCSCPECLMWGNEHFAAHTKRWWRCREHLSKSKLKEEEDGKFS